MLPKKTWFGTAQHHHKTMTPQDIVKRHIAQGKIAHAYLLAGPSACAPEKETFVREIAALLSVPPAMISFFGGAGTFSIDDVRRLRPLVSLAVGAHPQIIVLRDADTLTQQAANALLKTLEEPPSYTIFFLLASSRAGMLPTLLSRVWTVRFSTTPLHLPLARGENQQISPARTLQAGGPPLQGGAGGGNEYFNLFTTPFPARYAVCEKLAKQDDHGKQFVADLIAELRQQLYEEIKKPRAAPISIEALRGKNATDILPHAVEAYELLHLPGAPYRLILDTLASYDASK